MTLIQKQAVFSQYVAKLLLQAEAMGYQATLGEAWRPKETAILYAKDGRGITDSNHCIRLALDINLFRAGRLLSDTESYQPLGEWWEKQSVGEIICVWGGRFRDAYHFAFKHNGIQ